MVYCSSAVVIIGGGGGHVAVAAALLALFAHVQILDVVVETDGYQRDDHSDAVERSQAVYQKWFFFSVSDGEMECGQSRHLPWKTKKATKSVSNSLTIPATLSDTADVSVIS